VELVEEHHQLSRKKLSFNLHLQRVEPSKKEMSPLHNSADTMIEVICQLELIIKTPFLNLVWKVSAESLGLSSLSSYFL
jgi:hypothetical protein